MTTALLDSKYKNEQTEQKTIKIENKRWKEKSNFYHYVVPRLLPDLTSDFWRHGRAQERRRAVDRRRYERLRQPAALELVCRYFPDRSAGAWAALRPRRDRPGRWAADVVAGYADPAAAAESDLNKVCN